MYIAYIMAETITLDSVVSLLAGLKTDSAREDYESWTRRMYSVYVGFQDEVLKILDGSFSSGNYHVVNELRGHYMDVLRSYRKHATSDSDFSSTKEFLSKL